MKKIGLSVVAIVTISLTACKKDRTCECTSTSSNGNISSSTTTIKKIKKSEAKTLCQNFTSTYSSQNSPTQTDVNTCTLK